MLLRKFVKEDLDLIEQAVPFFAVQIKYNQGILKENIVCVEKDNQIIGVGFLTLHQTLNIHSLKVTFSTYITDKYKDNFEVESRLMDGLQKCFYELKEQKSGAKLYLKEYCETDEIRYMQFLLDKGFSINIAIPILKYDLSHNIIHYEIPTDITIQKLEFNESNMKDYLYANSLATIDMDAETDMWFNTGNPSFTCYVAKCDNKIVGAISVWNISDERGATENIFVIPEYRRKNIARELIATAFEDLKKRDLKIATLSLGGTNLRAMKLYLSLGYLLYYNLIEMVYK